MPSKFSSEVDCGLCRKKVKEKEFQAHVKKCHGVDIVKENLKFPSVEKFKEWKESLEQNIATKLIRKCSRKIIGSTEIIWFYCPQSKRYFQCGKHQIQRSHVDSTYCPASIKLTILFNGKCSVKFVKTHIGHNNINYSDILNKVDEHNRLYNLNEVVLERKDSLMFTEKKETVEMADEKKETDAMGSERKKSLMVNEKNKTIDTDIQSNSDDSFNINVWITKLKKSNCVLFYKARGHIIEECKFLHKDDFILVLMNQEQRKVLQKNDFDLIYFGGTRNINTYGYELNTLMIVDDMKQCIPCALFISNRVDEDVLIFVISFIHEYCGYITPKFVMSDINSAFFHAWIYIMNSLYQKQFSENSVKDDWKKQLSKIKSLTKRKEIYESLTNMMYENDVNRFDEHMYNLSDQLEYDLDITNCSEYITQTLDFCYYWAYCFRQEYAKEISTNISRMEKTLESIYLDEKYPIRLDKVVEHLLKFVDERLCFTSEQKLDMKLKNTQSRHEDSLQLNMFCYPFDKKISHPDEQRAETMKKKWQISSTCDSQEFYYVTENLDSCQCTYNCDKCNCCIHKYCCTCDDNAINWNICRHIHFICKLFDKKKTTHEDSLMMEERKKLKKDLRDLIMQVDTVNKCQFHILKSGIFLIQSTLDKQK